MDVRIDGVPLTDLPAEITTLGQVAAHARGTIPRQNLLVSIQIDGRAVEPDELEAALVRPVEQGQRVDFETSVTADAVLKVLTGADELFAETEQIQEQTIDLLRQGQTSKAREHMAHCFNVWQQTQSSVAQVCTLLDVDLETLEVGGDKFSEIITRLRDNLQEIKEALEARDFVLLADVLEYELKETTTKFRGVIGALSDLAREGRVRS